MAEALAKPPAAPQETAGAEAERRLAPLGEALTASLKEEREALPGVISAETEATRAEAALKTGAEKAGIEAEQAEIAKQRQQAAEIRGRLKEEVPSWQPTQETLGSYAQLASMIMTLGVMMGAGGKVPAKAALSSMTGMLDGWRKGRQDLWAQEAKNFDKNLASLKAHNDRIYKELDLAMQLWPTDRKAARDHAQNAFYMLGQDNVIGLTGKARDLRSAYELAGKGRDLQNKMLEKRLDLERDIEDKRLRSQERRDAAASTAAYRQAMLAGRETAEQKLIGRMGSGGVARHIYNVTGKALPAKDAEAVNNSVQALRQIDSLQQRLQDPEIQTGLRAVPAPVIEKLKSLFGSNIGEEQVQRTLGELTGTDKTTLFIKDAILAGFKIEQGLTGTRVPVFTQRTVGPILDPRSYSPETYNKLLQSRKEELYGVSADRDIEREDMDALSRIDRAIAPAPAPAAAQSIETQVINSFGSYEPNKYDYRISPEGRVQRKLKE